MRLAAAAMVAVVLTAVSLPAQQKEQQRLE